MILCVGELKMSFKDDYNDNKKSHKVLKHNIKCIDKYTVQNTVNKMLY